MHELSIALSILDQAAEEAQERGGLRVLAIHVRVGLLAGVVKEALLAAFEVAREGSPFPDARLVVEEVAVMAYCPSCCGPRPVRTVQQMCCATCGTPTPQVVCGRELEIVALEVP